MGYTTKWKLSVQTLGHVSLIHSRIRFTHSQESQNFLLLFPYQQQLRFLGAGGHAVLFRSRRK